jgi:hypothetical protein
MRRSPGRDSLDLVVSGDAVRLEVGKWKAAPMQISAEGVLLPAKPLDALLAGGVDWRNAAETWRSIGGVLNLERIEASRDRSKSIGSARLSLDSFHKLRGAVNLACWTSEFIGKFGQNCSDGEYHVNAVRSLY